MIKDKDYKLEYEQLIQRAKDSNRTKKDSSVYYERHHILPKCMGGLNEDRNYVLLTCKEYALNMPKYTHTYSLDTVSWLFGTFENMVKQAGFVTNGMESLYGAD